MGIPKWESFFGADVTGISELSMIDHVSMAVKSEFHVDHVDS
jgi:hypothetical protein